MNPFPFRGRRSAFEVVGVDVVYVEAVGEVIDLGFGAPGELSRRRGRAFEGVPNRVGVCIRSAVGDGEGRALWRNLDDDVAADLVDSRKR